MKLSAPNITKRGDPQNRSGCVECRREFKAAGSKTFSAFGITFIFSTKTHCTNNFQSVVVS